MAKLRFNRPNPQTRSVRKIYNFSTRRKFYEFLTVFWACKNSINFHSHKTVGFVSMQKNFVFCG